MKSRCLKTLTAVLLFRCRTLDRYFTPERWAALDDGERGKIVDSLLNQYDGLTGMEYNEVTALLGTVWTWNGGKKFYSLTAARKSRICCLTISTATADLWASSQNT